MILNKNNNAEDFVNICVNVNYAENIDSFGIWLGFEFSWGSEIKFNHLDPVIRFHVQNFLENNKDVFASSALE